MNRGPPQRSERGAPGAVLVLDRTGAFHAFVDDVLVPQGHRVHLSQDVQSAVASLEEHPVDVILVDVCVPRAGLLEDVEAVIHKRGRASTVVVTGCPLMTAAARVLYPDADGFLEKPCTPEELFRRVREAADVQVVDGEDSTPFHGIVGVSAGIRRVIEQIHTVGPTDSTVLVTGETGTGKELVARAIHRCSPRRDGPYVVVDALAMSQSLLESELFGHERGAFTGAVESSPGLFRAADGGTIFLDEMGDVSPAIQTRLLRAIQEREVRPVGSVEPRKIDVRVIAATHRNPEQLVDSGRLRPDLYYRLSVFGIEIPPLRERRVDIPPIVAHFLRSRASVGDGGDEATELAQQILQSYHWPGNVRELLAAVEAALIRARGRRLSALDLPRHLRVVWRKQVLSEDDVPASVISQVLQETNGHKGDAAELLGVSRTTLWRWMRRP